MKDKQIKRIVVKVGTSTLTYENGSQNLRSIEHLVRVISDLKNASIQVVLVSSGAIGVGVQRLGLSERPKTTPGKQAAAAVGQCELMYLYDKLFLEKSHKVAQVLLTRDVFDREDRALNARNTFERLMDMGAIPIVNENDTVAIEELEFGDNDTLSAMVACLVGADGLIILSDVDGLYAEDPNHNPHAKRIPVVDVIDEHIESIAGGSGTARGTGGMSTKIQAAKLCTAQGIPMVILNGADPNLLYDVLDGIPTGTLFTPQTH